MQNYLHYIQESTCTYNVRLVECKSWSEGFHLKTRSLRHEQYDTYIKFRKIPARSSSRARFLNLAQAVWCISSKNEGEKKVSGLEWNPSSLLQGWVLNLLVLSQFLGFRKKNYVTDGINQSDYFLEKHIMKQMWCWNVYTWSSKERKEAKISFTNSPVCQKHEHRVFPLIPSPHMLALLDLPDLSSVAYTLKNWPNEMAFLV